MEQRLLETALPITNTHYAVYTDARPKQPSVVTSVVGCNNFATMFGTVQVKQEYGGAEDSGQISSNAQGTMEYSAFTNQDVEYMYRQLPYFWNQTQLQTVQLSDDLPTKIEAPVTQDLPQISQITSQFSPANYFHQNVTLPTNQLQDSHNQQVRINSSLPERVHPRPQISAETSTVVHTGLNRPSKAGNPGKTHKCRCEVCFKEFGHKSNLFIHMRTHNGERPYKCMQCDKCFTHSGNLAIHMRTHSGERPYACQICGKMFSHSGNLSTHLRTHSGIKPYKCSVCSKEFRHSGNLSIHERIHSGVKPFKCKVCGKEFYHSGNLTTHMKKHPVTVSVEQSGDTGNVQQPLVDPQVDPSPSSYSGRRSIVIPSREITNIPNDGDLDQLEQQSSFPVKLERTELSVQDSAVMLVSQATVS